MLNLANPQPLRIARQARITRLELWLALAVFLVICLVTRNLWEQRKVIPSTPAPQVTPMPIQPLYQHFKVWKLLHQDRPSSLQLTQLEYASQQWLIHLQTEDLAQLYEWQQKLLEQEQLMLELQQSLTSSQGYRITFRVSLL